MTLNRELASLVYRYVTAHPERLDQCVYFGESECGTTACIAGWTCLLAGLDGARRTTTGTAALAASALGLDATMYGLGSFVDPLAMELFSMVFLELDPEKALRRFAAIFGLDPRTGDPLPDPESAALVSA